MCFISVVSDEIFDGFICYAKEDRSFAHEILTTLEAPPYCRKICIDFRDYVPGNCELDQTAKIIEHRCKRLVAVMSPNFTNSPDAGFQVRIALNLSRGERVMKEYYVDNLKANLSRKKKKRGPGKKKIARPSGEKKTKIRWKNAKRSTSEILFIIWMI